MPNIIDTPAATAHIVCRKLNSFNMEWYDIMDDDDNIIPLTDVEVVLTVWESNGTELLVFEDGAGIVVDIVEGKITFSKTDAQMDLDPGDYKYAVKLSFPNGDVVTWAVGRFHILDVAA